MSLIRSSTRGTVRTLTLMCALASALPAQGVGWPATTPDGPRVVTTAWLAEHLRDAELVVLQVQHDSTFTTGHVPGARALSYMDLTVRRNGLSTELPDDAALRAAFERVGVSDASFVVVYANDAPMATRALMSLEAIGHRRFALLDGGLTKWRAEHRPEERTATTFRTGTLSARARPDFIATADWLSARVGKPGLAPIDTRTDGEYIGEGERSGMPSAGHLAGARQLQWEELFQDEAHQLLKPRATLLQMYRERMSPGDTLVTYCWVGYRASATYFVARALDLPVRFYDGSYQDWMTRKLPVTKGRTP